MKQKKNNKVKKVRLWLYQHSLSGNANGHFDLFEGNVKSTRQDVIDHCRPYYYKVFGIKNLGVFTSGIGNKMFASKSFLNKFKPIKPIKKGK